MERRLYFLIPDRIQALAVVDDLVRHGIGIDHLYAIGDRQTRMDGLPGAPRRGSRNNISPLQRLIWKANTLCFAGAVIATFLTPIFIGLSWWLLLPVAIMVVNFMTGLYLNNTANNELGVFRDALAHGEILLIVTVPATRAAEVERDIQRHHPQATHSTPPGVHADVIGL
jgi:hypothetical protein